MFTWFLLALIWFGIGFAATRVLKYHWVTKFGREVGWKRECRLYNYPRSGWCAGHSDRNIGLGAPLLGLDMVKDWRRESDREMTRMSEQAPQHCELCGGSVEVASSGEGTNSYRAVERQRIAQLERLARDARFYVVHYGNHVGSIYAHDWLTRYREMFPEGR